jgi:hypothetical protein
MHFRSILDPDPDPDLLDLNLDPKRTKRDPDLEKVISDPQCLLKIEKD